MLAPSFLERYGDCMIKKLTAGILAHVDAGKTTLSEALLYETGVIRSVGRVDNKNAYLDTDSLERERGITIYSKNARIPVGDSELVLLDTPGHVDFSTEMERALSVLDMAILLISGPEGIQAHTKTLWSLLKIYRIPTVIFVNKMDMQGADKVSLLSQLRNQLSLGAVDFSEAETDNFYEDIASVDENAMDTYLSEGKLEDTKILELIGDRKIFPVYFGSALKISGVRKFIEGLERYMIPATYKESDSQEFGGRVYKISRDGAGKRITFLKVTDGSLKIKSLIGEEKVNELRVYSGIKYESVKEVYKGDICAIVGLENSKNGDAYGVATRGVSPVLAPALSYAVHFPKDIDKGQMLKILKEMGEEDSSLNVDYNEETREIQVSLMGDIQTEVLTRNLLDRYGVTVTFSDGKICYKETVDAVTEGVGHFEPLRHYAEAHIKIEPLERGSGMAFDADVSEDLLDKNWQRLILTHLMEREHRGPLLGAPITDIKLTVVAGQAHIKHTEGGDFRQATYRAIRQGLMTLRESGNVRLLEPYYDYSLEIPESYVGRAMTDITAMNGTANISENDFENHITILTGRAPVSTMNGYSKEVIAYTKGLGKLTLTVSGYDLCHNEEEILASSSYNPENDTRNTGDSVFCSHGSGTIIPWYEVPKYMHVPYSFALSGSTLSVAERKAMNQAMEANRIRQERAGKTEDFISTEEIDKIIRQTSYANADGRTGSYKGISAAMRERRNNERAVASESKPYVGKPQKDKYIIVDGYNVIHAWKELSELSKENLESASSKLNDELSNYQAIVGGNLIIVYDAYRLKGHPVEEVDYQNIKLVYTKENQTADQYIERFAHKYADKYDISVVTSDGLEQIIVVGEGCNLISSREFELDVARRKKEFYEKYGVN